METIYCPYTGRDVPLQETSLEHVFPRALGGNAQFSIPVHSKTNSHVGSKVDGEISREFVINRHRANHDARGHSGKVPLIVQKAKDSQTGKPIQLRWGKRLDVYDPIGRRRVKGVQFDWQFSIDVDIRLRFLAKAFLSGGYFTYGETFRSSVQMDDARLLMSKAPRDMSREEHASVRLRAFQWWSDELPPGQLEIFRLQNDICTVVDGSFLVFKPGRDRLEVFGSALGAYLGMLNVPANTAAFPRSGEHEVGHAIVVKGGRMRRLSLRDLIDEVLPGIEALRIARETSGDEP